MTITPSLVAPPQARTALCRVAALVMTTAAPFAVVLLAGCERSPIGPLQLTVPSSSPPATPAFASNSLQTAPTTSGATSVGLRSSADISPVASSGLLADGADVEQRCSVAGLLHAKQVSEDNFQIKRRDVHAVMSELQQRAKKAAREQLAPIRTETGSPGLRVLGVGASAHCGVETGDILVSLNGIPVVDQSRLAKNRETLRASDKIELVIERDRKSRVLTYAVLD
jgi:S1-C subfamily serine protease